jgi:hypothetical protein
LFPNSNKAADQVVFLPPISSSLSHGPAPKEAIAAVVRPPAACDALPSDIQGTNQLRRRTPLAYHSQPTPAQAQESPTVPPKLQIQGHDVSSSHSAQSVPQFSIKFLEEDLSCSGTGKTQRPNVELDVDSGNKSTRRKKSMTPQKSLLVSNTRWRPLSERSVSQKDCCIMAGADAADAKGGTMLQATPTAFDEDEPHLTHDRSVSHEDCSSTRNSRLASVGRHVYSVLHVQQQTFREQSDYSRSCNDIYSVLAHEHDVSSAQNVPQRSIKVPEVDLPCSPTVKAHAAVLAERQPTEGRGPQVAVASEKKKSQKFQASLARAPRLKRSVSQGDCNIMTAVVAAHATGGMASEATLTPNLKRSVSQGDCSILAELATTYAGEVTTQTTPPTVMKSIGMGECSITANSHSSSMWESVVLVPGRRSPPPFLSSMNHTGGQSYSQSFRQIVKSSSWAADLANAVENDPDNEHLAANEV